MRFSDRGGRSGSGAEQPDCAGNEGRPRERRRYGRGRLRLPILVRGLRDKGEEVIEVTRTENIGRGGLYFVSHRPYFKGARLQVAFPYWDDPGAINREYPAEVIRVDEHQEGKGVAIKFLVSLSKPGRRI